MSKEWLPQGLNLPEEITTLEKLNNKYLDARNIELSCLLSFLLENNLINKDNLKGPIIDLGTGSGIGLLALRKFTPAYLVGIDDGTHFIDGVGLVRNWYAGNYKIPVPEITQLAVGNFRRQEIFNFLKSCSFSATLVTAFYVDTKSWRDGYQYFLREIDHVLAPGGQFLYTTDQTMFYSTDLSQPNWAEETFHTTGNEGEYFKTLVLPVPEWVRGRYQINTQKTGSYLESEIYETAGYRIGLIRDRIVWIFTKKE